MLRLEIALSWWVLWTVAAAVVSVEISFVCPQAVSSNAAPIVSSVILVFILFLLRCAKNGQSFL